MKGAYIVCEDVQGAVVGVGFLVKPIPYVMLRDEVTREWMQASGEEA